MILLSTSPRQTCKSATFVFGTLPPIVPIKTTSHYGLFACLGYSSNRGLVQFLISLLLQKTVLYVVPYFERCQFFQNNFNFTFLSIFYTRNTSIFLYYSDLNVRQAPTINITHVEISRFELSICCKTVQATCKRLHEKSPEQGYTCTAQCINSWVLGPSPIGKPCYLRVLQVFPQFSGSQT